MFQLFCIVSISYIFIEFWFSHTSMSVTYKPQTCHIDSWSYVGCQIQHIFAIILIFCIEYKNEPQKNYFCCRARLCSHETHL